MGWANFLKKCAGSFYIVPMLSHNAHLKWRWLSDLSKPQALCVMYATSLPLVIFWVTTPPFLYTDVIYGWPLSSVRRRLAGSLFVLRLWDEGRRDGRDGPLTPLLRLSHSRQNRWTAITACAAEWAPLESWCYNGGRKVNPKIQGSLIWMSWCLPALAISVDAWNKM